MNQELTVLRVWHWNNGELSLEAHYEGISVSSIFVSDLNKNGTPEILNRKLGLRSPKCSPTFLIAFNGEHFSFG